MNRLTSFDLMFLRLETPEWPCHFGGLTVVEGRALLDDEGRLRIREIIERLERRLALVPQLRRRLQVPGPLGGRPVWVDDRGFAIERHVHQTSVAPPGDDEQLLETAALVYGNVLDRRRPLWELWFMTGLSEGRVGVMLKLHHSMADGMAAVAIMGSLFDLVPDAADPDPIRWTPETSPSEWSLFLDNVSTKMQALRRTAAEAMRPGVLQRASVSARKAGRIARSYAGRNPELQAPRTSLNRPVGEGRRVAVLRLDLAAMKEVAHEHEGKVNDVVLDLWSGGLRSLLESRAEPVAGVEPITAVPVSLRDGTAAGAVDNRSGWVALPLPAWEADAQRRLDLIIGRTRTTKAKQQPGAIAGFMAALAATPVARFYTTHQHTSNVLVTNVPGPPVPMYLLGALVRDVWPIVELVGNVGLALCAFSYAGRISLVVTADATSFPDLDELMEGMARDWHALIAAPEPSANRRDRGLDPPASPR